MSSERLLRAAALKARDEAVGEVAAGVWPAVALREADSQKRRVTFATSLRCGDANTRRVARSRQIPQVEASSAVRRCTIERLRPRPRRASSSAPALGRSVHVDPIRQRDLETQDPGAMHSRHQDSVWQGEEDVRSSLDALSAEVRVRVGVCESAVELRCPRCGLALIARSPWIAAEHCPRCVARARKLVVLHTDSADADRPLLRVAVDRTPCTRGTR